MRRLAQLIALLAFVGTASADPAHDEMAAALVAQIDAHPTPIALPSTAQAPRHAAAQSAVKRGIGPQAAEAQAHADAARAEGQATAAAHQAQAAAAAAAGQAQAQAARQRAAQHPHPHATR
jgi:hypothetical protein